MSKIVANDCIGAPTLKSVNIEILHQGIHIISTGVYMYVHT
jgi:hypothetical protein